jgi:hypothetical protein
MRKWAVAPLSRAAVVLSGCGEEPSWCNGVISSVGSKPVLLFEVTLLLLGVPLNQGGGLLPPMRGANLEVQPPLLLAAVAASMWPSFL